MMKPGSRPPIHNQLYIIKHRHVRTANIRRSDLLFVFVIMQRKKTYAKIPLLTSIHTLRNNEFCRQCRNNDRCDFTN